VSLRRPAVLSVVVPVRDDAHGLERALEALEASDLPRDLWELVVVDDASRDDSVAMAARHADTVVRLPDTPRGPAYARNRGIEVATGTFVAFVDADVRVGPTTLREMLETLRGDATLAAVSCAYDAGLASRGLVTGYRHLVLHHLQQRADGGDVLVSGCAMARRAAIREAGMFDEWRFPRPQVEDLELGNRMRALGHRVRLRADLQVRHDKRWTLPSAIVSDVRDRMVPFVRVLARSTDADASQLGRFTTATPLRASLVALGVAALVTAFTMGDGRLAIAGGALLGVSLLLNAGLLARIARVRGVLFAIAAAPLHLVFELVNGAAMAGGWLVYHLVGDPRPDPTLEAFAEVGVRTWPPVPARPAPDAPKLASTPR
jgi:GT2 family glycosyltransferase